MTEAVLLVSHGTIDDLDDLAAFLTKVRRGHPARPEVVSAMRGRYQAIGGRSPLNATSAEIARKLGARMGVTAAWANRLWKPFVADVLTDLARRGVGRVALVPLAQHSAHIYADDARSAAGPLRIDLACAPNWGDRPDLHDAFAARIAAALPREAEGTSVILTAHSLPRSVVDAGDPYERDLRAAAEAIGAEVRARVGRAVRTAVAFQSQGMSGPGPGGQSVEWLGPDLGAALDDARARGDRGVVFAPIGFLADHVEILYDLDVEARAMASERGLAYARSASLNADDDFIEVLVAVARPLLGARRS